MGKFQKLSALERLELVRAECGKRWGHGTSRRIAQKVKNKCSFQAQNVLGHVLP